MFISINNNDDGGDSGDDDNDSNIVSDTVNKLRFTDASAA